MVYTTYKPLTINLYNYSKVINMNMLKNCHTLNLSEIAITDVSMLGNVHTLDLSYTNITDVSSLRNVHN